MTEDSTTSAFYRHVPDAADEPFVGKLQALSVRGEPSPSLPGGGRSEFCGVCFSPDGKVMFVNVQETGTTLAVTGPFPGA